VIAGFGPKANFLQFLLMRLGFVLLLLLLQKLELAVVHDLADRRPLLGGHLDQIQLRFARQIQRLLRRHDAQLFPIDANEADRTDANLFVHALKIGTLCSLRSLNPGGKKSFSFVTEDARRTAADQGWPGWSFLNRTRKCLIPLIRRREPAFGSWSIPINHPS